MKKFSYADEFKNVTGICRIGNVDDLKEEFRYNIFCGDPDLEQTFCGAERFISANFKSYADAERCMNFTRRVLELVDEQTTPVSNSADLRRAVLQALKKALDEAADATKDEPDHGLIAAVYFATTLCAVNAAFAEYSN